MKVIVQRVKKAQVTVNQSIISAINHGFVLLVGLKQGDTAREVEYCARKVAKLRIFDDKDGKLNLSIKQVSGKILSISQFTVYGNAKKSNRPSFTDAMDFSEAQILYQKFNQLLAEEYQIPVETGVFGRHMEVELINDGPVTIIIERV